MMGQNFNLDLCHLHILLIYSFVLGKYNFPKISIDIYYIIYKNKNVNIRMRNTMGRYFLENSKVFCYI